MAWAKWVLPTPGGPTKRASVALRIRVAGRQFVDLLAGDAGIEAPVEVFEGLERAELGGASAQREFALFPDVEFVVQDQFEELGMGEPVGRGLLEAHGKGLAHGGQTQLFEDGVEVHGEEKASMR
jgi:hypothetical protein